MKIRLPAGYRLVTGPNGTISVHNDNDEGSYYSLEAWKLIEKGEGLWKSQHDAIFPPKAKSHD